MINHLRIKEQNSLIFLGIIMIGAMALRLYNINDHPLWIDEAYSYWFSQQSWNYLWNETYKFETHPPLYYSILKLWTNIGSSEFILRLLSALVNISTIPLIYKTTCLLSNKENGYKIGLFAALIFMLSTQQIYQSQNARPYVFLIFSVALVNLCIVSLITREKPEQFNYKNSILLIFALGIGTSLLQWFHNTAIIFILSNTLFLVCWWAFSQKYNKKIFIALLTAAFISIALYAPFLPNLLEQISTIRDGFWISIPTLQSALFTTEKVYELGTLGQYTLKAPLIFSVLLLSVITFGTCTIWRINKNSMHHYNISLFILGAICVPYILSLIISLTIQPIFLDRLLLPIQTSWFILLAFVPFFFQNHLRIFLVCLILISFLLNIWFYQSDVTNYPNKKYKWDIIVEDISKERAGIPILIVRNSLELVLDYYADKSNYDINIIALPAPYPAISNNYTYPNGGRGVPRVEADFLNQLPKLYKQHTKLLFLVRKYNVMDKDMLTYNALNNLYPKQKIIYDDGHINLYLFEK